MRKYIKKKKNEIRRALWRTFLVCWFFAFLFIAATISAYFLHPSIFAKAPFEGKNTFDECMKLSENSMRSICLIHLADSELFKDGSSGACKIVWQWRGGGSHDMLNSCYTRAAKYLKNIELCKNLKKYGFNTNSMYNPEGYDSGCLGESFSVLTIDDFKKLKLDGVCNNLRWRYDNEKNNCLNRYTN